MSTGATNLARTVRAMRANGPSKGFCTSRRFYVDLIKRKPN
jgi:hypothetical protein